MNENIRMKLLEYRPNRIAPRQVIKVPLLPRNNLFVTTDVPTARSRDNPGYQVISPCDCEDAWAVISRYFFHLI